MTTDKKTLAVDVLNEMERASERLFDAGLHGDLSLDVARDAVAELIEASDRALIALAQAEEALERRTGFGQSINQLAANGEAEEYADLSVALARVKGESA
ncbi:hypothetical protein ACNPMX_11775 [Stenotrophomonas maltophilia]